MKLSDESDDKSVITTRYVMDADSEIIFVVHDEDGDWQFFGDENFLESDACIVPVKQILEIDETLHNLDLKPGQAAERSDIDSPWHTVRFKKGHLLMPEEEET